MPTTTTQPALWVRAIRCQRRLSQRELATLAQLPRSTIDRIEAGTTDPRFGTFCTLLSATGHHVVVRDRHGSTLTAETVEGPRDRGGRSYPAHLRVVTTPPYGYLGNNWWGWHHIAWPHNDDWVPGHTFWKRDPPRSVTSPRFEGREIGQVWDDAT